MTGKGPRKQWSNFFEGHLVLMFLKSSQPESPTLKFGMGPGQSTVHGMKLIPLDGMLKLGLKVLVQLPEVCSHFMSMLRWNRLKGHFEFGVEALVVKKGVTFVAECIVLLYANS